MRTMTMDMNIILVALLLSVVSYSSTVCVFPESVQIPRTWYHRYIPVAYSNPDGSSISQRAGLEIRFTSTKMEAIFTLNNRRWPFNSSDFDSYVRTCVEVVSESNATYVDGQSYIISEKIENEPLRYRCMQLVNRTNFVFQVKLSAATTERPDTGATLCGSISLDPWPIVRYTYDHESITAACPADGGYPFSLSDQTLYTETGAAAAEIRAKRCQNLALDLECLPGENVRIDFKDGFCEPYGVVADSLKSYLQLQCIATWKESHYTFRLLSRYSDFYTLRFSTVHDDSFKAFLFKGAIIDATLNLNLANSISRNLYVELSVKRKRQYDLCENDQADCENPSCLRDLYNHFANRCLKTCNLCNATYNALTVPCDFESDLQGTWKNAQNEVLRINGSFAKIPGYGQFQCIDVKRVQQLEGTVVLATFDNGCRPRFKCLSLIRERYTLKWRMGKGFEPWPGYGPTLPDHVTVCHADARLQWSEWRSLSAVDVLPVPGSASRHVGFLKTFMLALLYAFCLSCLIDKV
ncbi:uncharacterized protein LOC106166180 [Lingula anatina]|uniref:Uncharacterized protein LOC106166180 n=1 Tax=Lingula anatina TaxID=7574 RepID=A0A1S3IPG0_LINAN|nr:uncharacterized protein LOC106166180 [Lingula anatina]|eukprot:XP_013400105.1 uncharacterized protein LOC106166180 [Lingula anatina]